MDVGANSDSSVRPASAGSGSGSPAGRDAAVIPNPVIPGFHPDPSVCRVGPDYYLACSSFEYFPGVPLFHSRDLRTWTQLGNVLDRPEQVRLREVPSSGGIFAPTLRHHDNRFWLVTTNPWDGGHLIVHAEDPAGPWSAPLRLPGLPGIDPDLAWDGTGTCWLTYSVFPDGSRPRGPAPSGIMQVPVDPERGLLLAEPRPLWSGSGLAFPEGPHLYRVGGFWYLLVAEGGTERGHAVSVARALHPAGPFDGCPDNPVLSMRSTGAEVQNAGHGDLVQAVDGAWWMVLLGVRPRGGTPAFHVQGRETFLVPVRWVDGWPRPDRSALHQRATPEPVRWLDDFDRDTLALQWLAVRRPPEEFGSLHDRPGWLTLRGADPAGLDHPLPAFLGRRQQHPRCRLRCRVDAREGRGGLAVRLDERHHYELEVGAGRVGCWARIGPLRQQLAARAVDVEGPVVLRLQVEPEPAELGRLGAPPDRIQFGVELEDTFVPLADLDGRYLSTEVAGGFTGRVLGVYAGEGVVAFDWVEYTA